MTRLNVVVATPLSDQNADRIRQLEPRVDLIHRPDLTGPASADWMAVFDRPAELQQPYEDMLDSAEVLFGVPDASGRALARTVAANPGLRWVHTIPAGGGQQVKSAQLDRADLDRILFSTSAGVHAEPLAEWAVMAVLAGMKRLPYILDAQRRHEWAPRVPMALAADTTVAVVGLGSIGRATAKKLAALGFQVVGVHRHPVEVPGVGEVRLVSELAQVASEVDAIVLALPGTDQTDRMLSRAVLASIKDGATVVNVGRGTTVDEPALIEALHDGRVGFAALDVMYVEPLPAESPLWSLPNVLLAPHTAAISDHEPRLIAELFAENARRLLDGEPLLNRVDTVEFY